MKKGVFLVFLLLILQPLCAAVPLACIKKSTGKCEIRHKGRIITPSPYLSLHQGTRISIYEAGSLVLLLRDGREISLTLGAELLLGAAGIKPLNSHTAKMVAESGNILSYATAASRGNLQVMTDTLRTLDRVVRDPVLRSLLKIDVYRRYGLMYQRNAEIRKYRMLIRKR